MNDLAAPRRTNRRLTARRTCHITVTYRTDGEWRPATAMDLSRHGCRLRIGEDIDRTSRLEVLLELAGTELPEPIAVQVVGKVIWARPEGLSYQVGVQFGTAAPEGLDRIMNALGA